MYGIFTYIYQKNQLNSLTKQYAGINRVISHMINGETDVSRDLKNLEGLVIPSSFMRSDHSEGQLSFESFDHKTIFHDMIYRMINQTYLILVLGF